MSSVRISTTASEVRRNLVDGLPIWLDLTTAMVRMLKIVPKIINIGGT
jgi:hypothetical protein